MQAIVMQSLKFRNRVTDSLKDPQSSNLRASTLTGAAFSAAGGALYSDLISSVDSIVSAFSSYQLYVGTLLILFGASLPAIARSRFSHPNHESIKISHFTKEFKQAILTFATFNPKSDGRNEIQKVLGDISEILAKALSSEGRDVRLVLYMAERTHDADRDATGSVDGIGARFFRMECFGGREDHPRNDHFDSRTTQGEFFCERMIMRTQVVVNDAAAWRWREKLTYEDTNSYRSFIVTPICDEANGTTVTIGAVSIDYPGKSSFSPVDSQLAWTIAKLYLDAMRAIETSAFETKTEFTALSESIDPEREG